MVLQSFAQAIHHHPVRVVVLAAGVVGGDQAGDVVLSDTIPLKQQLQEPSELGGETESSFDLNELCAISHCYIIDNTERLSTFETVELVSHAVDVVEQ